MNPEQELCKNCYALQMPLAMYCHACGQKHQPERLDYKTLFTEFVVHYLGFDGVFFTTFKSMFQRPGPMVREYLSGRTKPYMKPVQYFLLTLGLYFTLFVIFGLNPLEAGLEMSGSKDIKMSNNESVVF